jgi:cytochrome c
MRVGAAWLLAAPAIVAVLVAMAGADVARGERVFQRCFACHSVLPGETTLPGPNLRGVIGRRAGTLAGFRFSPAMVEAGARGLVWSRETLDAYVTDPLALVPGTEMVLIPGLRDPHDRADLIDYLQAHP